jgi:ABC-type multidrug transport system ATPase subunit
MITIDHLTMSFGRQKAVADVSIQVEAGESVALWGTNGAGKSTILRCVMGLLRFSGAIRIGGLDVQRCGKQSRQLIGYVPQELGFYDDLRVSGAIQYFGALKGVRGKEVDSTLDRVGLLGHGKKRIRELSGGMKQRLALALALINDPPVLILDEVTASLDACGRGEFVSLLSNVITGGKQTMLFASHRVEEIQNLASRVVTLEAGKMIRNEAADAFVAKWGETLHLYMDLATARRSLQVLASNGVDARLNGRGILIPVTRGERAIPLRVLAENQISYDDLELLVSSPEGGVK